MNCPTNVWKALNTRMILGVLSGFSKLGELVRDRQGEGGPSASYNINLVVSPPRHVQLTVTRHLRTVPGVDTNKILY